MKFYYGFKVLREIMCQLQSSVYTVMIDETTDISNAEHVDTGFPLGGQCIRCP